MTTIVRFRSLGSPHKFEFCQFEFSSDSLTSFIQNLVVPKDGMSLVVDCSIQVIAKYRYLLCTSVELV